MVNPTNFALGHLKFTKGPVHPARAAVLLPGSVRPLKGAVEYWNFVLRTQHTYKYT